jgi:hypothetical protein
MARFVQKFFGLGAPERKLRQGLNAAPTQILVFTGLTVLAFADPLHSTLLRVICPLIMVCSLALLLVSYVLQSRELARRDRLYVESEIRGRHVETRS